MIDPTDVRRVLNDAGVDTATEGGQALLMRLIDEAWDWSERLQAAGCAFTDASATFLGARSLASAILGARTEEADVADEVAVRLAWVCLRPEPPTPEPRSFAGLPSRRRLDELAPAHHAREAAADAQAQAGPAVLARGRARRLHERLEELLLVPGRDADACVLDCHV